MVDLMFGGEERDFVGVRHVGEAQEASKRRRAEEMKRCATLGPKTEGDMVICFRSSSGIERLTDCEPVPSGESALACLSLVGTLVAHAKTYGAHNLMLVTFGDEFGFCAEGRCSHRSFCRGLPEGMRVISVHPLSETVAIRRKDAKSKVGVSAL